uniref:Uncharacterized protein n=1 Tax=Pleurozia purpurea TaxID=280637 RepID=D0R016_9MARC|nr:hypothetical protein PlpuMp16 [Pleurozia purpurea]ACR19353.1 hypothetical protein PlpuMp16 [Pleurozia purpurea]
MTDVGNEARYKSRIQKQTDLGSPSFFSAQVSCMFRWAEPMRSCIEGLLHGFTEPESLSRFEGSHVNYNEVAFWHVRACPNNASRDMPQGSRRASPRDYSR